MNQHRSVQRYKPKINEDERRFIDAIHKMAVKYKRFGYRRITRELKKQVACKQAADVNDSNLIFTAEPDKGHAHAIDHFVDEIQGTGPVVCGVDDAVMATRVAFAAIKTAAEKRIVKINEV